MKKLVLIALCALFGSLMANAQYVPAQPEKGANLSTNFFGQVLANGQKISNEELTNFLDSYQYADIKDPLRKTKGGLITAGVGLGLVATGVVAYECFDDLLYAIFGWPCLIGGLVCTGIGVPKFFINKSKVNKVLDAYNQGKAQPTLSFGPQQNGIGFALNF